jgi:hypothetical protein
MVLGCSGRREQKRTNVSDQHFVDNSFSLAVLGIASTSFRLNDMFSNSAYNIRASDFGKIWEERLIEAIS